MFNLLYGPSGRTDLKKHSPHSVPFFGDILDKSQYEAHQHTEGETKETSAVVDNYKGEVPKLHYNHESTTIQLFFDLFFVANLTTFTQVHEVNDSETLKSYIGFFGVLWATWLQIALHDVRFGRDSVMERFCKLLHFGVMTGFAVVGPGFRTDWSQETEEEQELAYQALLTFKQLTVILFVSRFVLAAQYGIVTWRLRKFNSVIVPMLAQISVFIIAGAIYLGLYWYYFGLSQNKGDIVWYLMMFVEVACVLLVSAKWKWLSFRKTPIIERLGLLTLIILGEGVIGLCGSIQKVGMDGIFASDIIGMIICGVLILFSIWMLYFDQVETERIGNFRQIIWIIFHFPLHTTMVLVLEGTSNLATWQKIVDVITQFENGVTSSVNLYANSTNVAAQTRVQLLLANVNSTSLALFSQFPKAIQVPPDLEDGLIEIAEAPIANITDAVWEWAAECSTWVTEVFKIEASERHLARLATEDPGDPNARFAAVIASVQTICQYFFVCAGLLLIVITALNLVGRRKLLRADYLSGLIKTLVGAGVISLSVMFFPTNNQAVANNGMNFQLSPWMLPTITLTYVVIVAIDNLLIQLVRRAVRHIRRNSLPSNSIDDISPGGPNHPRKSSHDSKRSISSGTTDASIYSTSTNGGPNPKVPDVIVIQPDGTAKMGSISTGPRPFGNNGTSSPMSPVMRKPWSLGLRIARKSHDTGMDTPLATGVDNGTGTNFWTASHNSSTNFGESPQVSPRQAQDAAEQGAGRMRKRAQTQSQSSGITLVDRTGQMSPRHANVWPEASWS